MFKDGRQQNRLTHCFEDIMRVGAEMLVQQQMKTIQLGSDVAAGFTKSQHKSLGEKVHLFHTILDDLDLTLSASTKYLEAMAAEAVERRQQKQKEELQQRQQHEQQQQLQQQQQRQQQQQQQEQEQQQQQRQQHQMQQDEEAKRNRKDSQQPEMNQSPIDLTVPTPGSLLNESGGVAVTAGSSRNGNFSDFNDLNDLDLSMFGGLDQNDLGLNDYNENPQSAPASAINGDPSNINTPKTNTNVPTGASNPTNMNSNLDSYLTLNDFNDLGMDWNTNDEQGGLDMSDFNL